MKCPWCKTDVSVTEYEAHLKSCPVARERAKKFPTLKQLFKGEKLNGYIEAAKVKPLTEFIPEKKEVQWKITGEESGKLVDFFFNKLRKGGVELPSLFRDELDKALDPAKTYDEHLTILEKVADDIIEHRKNVEVAFRRMGQPTPECSVGDVVRTSFDESVEIVGKESGDKFRLEGFVYTVKKPDGSQKLVHQSAVLEKKPKVVMRPVWPPPQAFGTTAEKALEKFSAPVKYVIEKFYVIHAPHLKPKEWVLQYQIQGSWDTLSFESLDAVSELMRQGQATLYVHVTRGREVVGWTPIEIPMYKLKIDTKWVQFEQIDWHLEQPIFVSTGLGYDTRPQWTWRIRGYDREKREAKNPIDAKEEDLLKGHYSFPVQQSEKVEKKEEEHSSKFTNWVVVQQSIQTKERIKSIGVASEEEASKVAYEWRMELLKTGKDRWYEVVIQPPPSEKVWQAWIQPILEYVVTRTVEEGWAKEEDVYREFKERGAAEEEVKQVLGLLIKEGTLYTPRAGYLKKT